MVSTGQHGTSAPAVFGAPDGPVLTIEYCAPCNYLPRTLWHAQELLASLATSVSALRLVPADNGRYTVTLGTTELFSKEKEGRFPEVAELLAAAFAALAPAPAPAPADKLPADPVATDAVPTDAVPVGSVS